MPIAGAALIVGLLLAVVTARATDERELTLDEIRQAHDEHVAKVQALKEEWRR